MKDRSRNGMREFAVIVLLVGCGLPALATWQAGDWVKYEGEFHITPIFPLESHPAIARMRPNFSSGCSGLVRGYSALWEVREGRLYLTRLDRHSISLPDLPPADLEITVPLETLFPGQVEDGGVHASWFSGAVFSPGRRWGSLPEKRRAELMLEAKLKDGVARLVGNEVHTAAKEGNVERIRQIARSDPGAIDGEDEYGRRPLRIAFAFKREDAALFLIRNGCDTTATVCSALNPLVLACRNGWLETVKALVEERGVDLEAHGSPSLSPLTAACGGGHEKIARYLLSRGADPDGPPHHHNCRPIHVAVSMPSLLKEFVRRGASVDAADDCGHTALHFAAGVSWVPSQEAYLESVKFLLSRGARVDVGGYGGRTSLDMARSAKFDAATAALIAAGAKADE